MTLIKVTELSEQKGQLQLEQKIFGDWQVFRIVVLMKGLLSRENDKSIQRV